MSSFTHPYHTSFKTPEGLHVGVEYMPPTVGGDAYIVAFYPDDEKYPERMEPDDVTTPTAWLVLGEAAMGYKLTGGN